MNYVSVWETELKLLQALNMQGRNWFHRGIRKVRSQGSNGNRDLEMIPGKDLINFMKCQDADIGLRWLSLPVRQSGDIQASGLISNTYISNSCPSEPILSLMPYIRLNGGDFSIIDPTLPIPSLNYFSMYPLFSECLSSILVLPDTERHTWDLHPC